MKKNLKIKNGDMVQIIAGKDISKKGKITRIIAERERVSVEGVNVYKKRVRSKNANEKGQVVEVSRPVHISNVQFMCSSCGKRSKIGIKINKEGKNRFCKKCGANI